jgi:hypothetical protein
MRAAHWRASLMNEISREPAWSGRAIAKGPAAQARGSASNWTQYRPRLDARPGA